MKYAICALAAISIAGWGPAGPAAAVTPTFDRFGDLPDATFGGTGIPTDPTAVTEVELENGQTLTLGLSATQRFQNPPLGNDGAGTYFATAGLNDGTPGSTSGLLGTTWNFNFFAEVTGVPTGNGILLEDLDIDLLYDFDPGTGTAESELGTIALSSLLAGSGNTLSQGSQNLAFSFLDDASVTGVTPPVFPNFDPLAGGEYSFALRSLAGEVAINVDVEGVAANVPLPAPAALLLAGLAALAGTGLRRPN